MRPFYAVTTSGHHPTPFHPSALVAFPAVGSSGFLSVSSVVNPSSVFRPLSSDLSPRALPLSPSSPTRLAAGSPHVWQEYRSPPPGKVARRLRSMIASRKDHCCPLCGRPNHCGEPDPAKPHGGCWCFHRHLPPGLLARVPEQRRHSPGLCPDRLAKSLGQQPPSVHPDLLDATRSEPQLGVPCAAALAFEINDEDRVSHALRANGLSPAHGFATAECRGASYPIFAHILKLGGAIRHLTQHGGNGVHPKLT